MKWYKIEPIKRGRVEFFRVNYNVAAFVIETNTLYQLHLRRFLPLLEQPNQKLRYVNMYVAWNKICCGLCVSHEDEADSIFQHQAADRVSRRSETSMTRQTMWLSVTQSALLR